MEYRTLGSTGLKVSVLGFGCIRFNSVSEEDVARALGRALDLGITYFDTARAYGDSEAKIGRAIASRRAEYVLSTKSGTRDGAGLIADLETSLRDLRTEAVDLFFLHTVSDPAAYEAVMAPGGALEALLRAKEQGKVRHTAVSIHRDLATMQRAIDSGAFGVLMAAYSVVDPEGAGAMLPVAAAAGLGTVIMKPLSGGQLASPPGPDGGAGILPADGGAGILPADGGAGILPANGGAGILPVRRTADGTPAPHQEGRRISPDPVVEGALRWVASNPSVSSVIPGMISARQVEENVAAIEKGPLSEAERQDLLRRVGDLRKAYRYGQVCLRCGYCQPCPEGIDAPAIFRAADMVREYPDNLKHMGRELYEQQEFNADNCVECRKCVERCPAGLDIPKRLREVATLFRPGTRAGKPG